MRAEWNAIGALFLSYALSLVAIHSGSRILGKDSPVPGSRKLQKEAVPLVGALCLPIPLLLLGPQHTALKAGLCAAVLVGFLDDRLFCGLAWFLKLLGQCLAATLYCALASRTGEPIFVIFWLVLSMNAWNMLDNSDGVVSATALGGLLVATLLLPAESATIRPMLLVLMAALLGFLPFNWPKAAAYLGDGGSHALGFTIGVLSLELFESQGPAAFLLLSFVPLFDMLQVVLVRLKLGLAPWRGDRRHLAQRLAAVLPSFSLAPVFLLAQAILGLIIVLVFGNDGAT